MVSDPLRTEVPRPRRPVDDALRPRTPAVKEMPAQPDEARHDRLRMTTAVTGGSPHYPRHDPVRGKATARVVGARDHFVTLAIVRCRVQRKIKAVAYGGATALAVVR